MELNEAMKAALEIVKAQAGARPMTEEEITSMVRNVAAGISAAASGEAAVNCEAGSSAPAMDPKKAITENHVTCLCCGKKFKVLTKKHLAVHGLTPEEYRAKYGYKKTQALAAKALVRERRKKMKEMALWLRRKKPAVEAQQ